MNKIGSLYWASCLIFICFPCLGFAHCGITNSTKCGRLGDQLVELAETIYLADKHQLDLYLTPFKYFDAFEFSSVIPPRPKKMNEVSLQIHDLYRIKYVNNTLYVFHTISGLKSPPKIKRSERFDWKEAEFVKKLRSLFSLRKDVATVSLPEGRASIALHIRTGGRLDGKAVKNRLSKKFTSIPFAVQSLKSVNSYFKEAPLYIHIFTDDVQPFKVLKMMQAHVPYNNIQWGVSAHETQEKGVLEDLFSMTKFNALVAPDSNFSFIAWVLGDHQITFRQKLAHYKNEEIIVDEYEVLDNFGLPVLLP